MRTLHPYAALYRLRFRWVSDEQRMLLTDFVDKEGKTNTVKDYICNDSK